jgi:putative hydrolase of the HAD superfamily
MSVAVQGAEGGAVRGAVRGGAVGPANIVFDFGAVLVNWQPMALLTEFFPSLANTPSQAGHLAHEVFGHPDWHAFDRGTMTMGEVINRTSVCLGLDRTLFQVLVEGIGLRLSPMPASMQLLERLCAARKTLQSTRQGGLRLYYLSNMPVDYARVLEREFAFVRQFDGGVFSGDAGHIKPESAIYELLQQRYALEPENTMFIDDLLDNVRAAQALGWSSLVFHDAGAATAGVEQWLVQQFGIKLPPVPYS